ncbi:TIGR02302 family protein [Salinarimonas rosea]|uniref:TIGR02302 family protein n=1 Tax=Salinarimonas rosea TaxID=552063 RepID=UPI0009FD0EEE|nr:TIGR02302 family protein [Salinarimonas rosea]
MSDEREPVRLGKKPGSEPAAAAPRTRASRSGGAGSLRLFSRARPDRDPADPRARLDRLVRRAGLALLWERAWPALWAPLAVAIAFLSVSWLGLWIGVPPTWRMAGAGLFGLAFLVSLVPLARLALPGGRIGRAAALARLDRSSGLPHRPASTFEDSLAIGAGDEGSRALWALHRARAERALGALRAGTPRPGMARRDRYALRGAGVLVLAASAFVAGPEIGARVGAAFDWRAPLPAAPDYRIDGWIDPPLYTRRPPLMIDLASGGAHVRVPAGSRVVVRVAGRADAQIEAVGGLVAIEDDKPARTPVAVGDAPAGAALAAPAIVESRFRLDGDGELSVRTGLVPDGILSLEAIPDTPPTIRFAGPPEPGQRGVMTLRYEGGDDYGIARVVGDVRRGDMRRGDVRRGEGAPVGRTLVPPPTLDLPVPSAAADGPVAEEIDLTEHYWAGAPIDLALVATDDAGQEGRSETVSTTLPQRPFFDPLARALVEQRRNLVFAPDDRRRVQVALDALLIEPARFTPEWGVFLGLRAASSRLREAEDDADLVALADWLWEMAVQIEDGDLSQAQRDAIAAAERLEEAMERDAPQDEIDQLMAELREAMDRMLRELAEQMMREEQNREQADLPPDAETQTLSRQDLDRMMEALEEAMREGDTARAEELMNQLRDIMRNLQTARPDSRMSDPMAREMDRQMNELDELMRGQSELRDETFQDGQQGQQGQERQQGQQGQEGQQGGSLSERQQALRERLQDLQRSMRELGMEGEEGLSDAEQAMRDAEGALGEGDQGQAVDDQGRALEGLQRGMQGMAQQMQEMMGEGQGEQAGQPGRPGQRGRADARADDPLGRPTRGRDFSDGDVRVPEAGESAAQRARRIMEELRDKLGDPTRPRDELDYFERLLRQN